MSLEREFTQEEPVTMDDIIHHMQKNLLEWKDSNQEHVYEQAIHDTQQGNYKGVQEIIADDLAFQAWKVEQYDMMIEQDKTKKFPDDTIYNNMKGKIELGTLALYEARSYESWTWIKNVLGEYQTQLAQTTRGRRELSLQEAKESLQRIQKLQSFIGLPPEY